MQHNFMVFVFVTYSFSISNRGQWVNTYIQISSSTDTTVLSQKQNLMHKLKMLLRLDACMIVYWLLSFTKHQD